MQALLAVALSFQPPPPPAPPAPPTPIGGGGGGVARIVVPGGATPQAVYEAARARGEELSRQMERLEDRRGELSRQLRESGDPADRQGLQQQLTDVDARISSLNQQIAASDQQIAQAAGVPGAIQKEHEPVQHGPPDEIFIIPIVFTIFVLFPLAIAYARRIWRRTGVAPAAIPPEFGERMERIERAVESVAEEVERIGEGQRFVTKLFAETGQRSQLEAPR